MIGYTHPIWGTVSIFREPKARRVSFFLAAALLCIGGLLASSALFSGWSGEAHNIIWAGAGLSGLFGMVAAFVRAFSGVVVVDPRDRRISYGRKRTMSFRDVKAVLVVSRGPEANSPACQLRLATRAEDREGLASLQKLEAALKQAEPADAIIGAEERLEALAPLYETPSILVTSSVEPARARQTAAVISEVVGVPLVELPGHEGEFDLIELHRLLRLGELDDAPENRGAGISYDRIVGPFVAVSLVLGLLGVPVAAYYRGLEEERDARLLVEVFEQMSDHEDREIRGGLLPRAKLATEIAVSFLHLSADAGSPGAVPKGAIAMLRGGRIFTGRFLDELERSATGVELLETVARGHRARKTERQLGKHRWIVVRTDGVEFTTVLRGRRWLIDAIDISKRTPRARGHK